MECLRCSNYDPISTHRLFRFSKQNRVSNSMRKPKSQCVVLKWKSNSRKLTNTRLRCEMQVEKIADYARAKSTAAAAAAVAAVAAAAAAACALCSTAVMRRLSIDAMCVKRAARCARGAVTRPRAQSTYHFFADRSRLRQKQNSAQSTRVSMQHQQSTKPTAAYRCCVCTLPRLRRIRRPRVGMASPHGPCLW